MSVCPTIVAVIVLNGIVTLVVRRLRFSFITPATGQMYNHLTENIIYAGPLNVSEVR